VENCILCCVRPLCQTCVSRPGWDIDNACYPFGWHAVGIPSTGPISQWTALWLPLVRTDDCLTTTAKYASTFVFHSYPHHSKLCTVDNLKMPLCLTNLALRHEDVRGMDVHGYTSTFLDLGTGWYGGWMYMDIHPRFLTSALVGGEWWASRPFRFTPGTK
jgi:hypothetical protein